MLCVQCDNVYFTNGFAVEPAQRICETPQIEDLLITHRRTMALGFIDLQNWVIWMFGPMLGFIYQHHGLHMGTISFTVYTQLTMGLWGTVISCDICQILVGGDWNRTFIFPYIWNVIIPVDQLIFFRGVQSTNHIHR